MPPGTHESRNEEQLLRVAYLISAQREAFLIRTLSRIGPPSCQLGRKTEIFHQERLNRRVNLLTTTSYPVSCIFVPLRQDRPLLDLTTTASWGSELKRDNQDVCRRSIIRTIAERVDTWHISQPPHPTRRLYADVVQPILRRRRTFVLCSCIITLFQGSEYLCSSADVRPRPCRAQAPSSYRAVPICGQHITRVSP
jgi:hypothetical protein